MKTHTVTITSKNQITLPAELVRNLGLQKGSRLVIKQKAKGVELNPEPSFRELMAPFHKKMAKKLEGKRPLTDKELSSAARDIWASGDVKFR